MIANAIHTSVFYTGTDIRTVTQLAIAISHRINSNLICLVADRARA
jgi:hypothetical protein